MIALTVPDGTILTRSHGTITGRDYAAGHAYEIRPNALLAGAIDHLVARMTRKLAPTQIPIKIRKDQTLRTADRRDADKGFHFTKNFDPAQEIILVLQLPAAAERNAFSVDIVARDESEPIRQWQVEWTRDMTDWTETVQAGELLWSNPGHKFTARLIKNERIVIEHKFEVK
jgi:hypothetical protein